MQQNLVMDWTYSDKGGGGEVGVRDDSYVSDLHPVNIDGRVISSA